MRTFQSIQKNEQAANRKGDVNYEYKLHNKVYIKIILIAVMIFVRRRQFDGQSVNFKRIKPVPPEKGENVVQQTEAWRCGCDLMETKGRS
ncbi:hypothetical protein HZS_6272 [Henneguya salminicola]|nr:hypothetical protein HZS_6272 [Henneguya salminicola]